MGWRGITGVTHEVTHVTIGKLQLKLMTKEMVKYSCHIPKF